MPKKSPRPKHQEGKQPEPPTEPGRPVRTRGQVRPERVALVIRTAALDGFGSPCYQHPLLAIVPEAGMSTARPGHKALRTSCTMQVALHAYLLDFALGVLPASTAEHAASQPKPKVHGQASPQPRGQSPQPRGQSPQPSESAAKPHGKSAAKRVRSQGPPSPQPRSTESAAKRVPCQ